jgi:hypothetical protein
VGANISLGLSWERTALDFIYELQHHSALAALHDCPWLVVRLGVDGAILWQRCRKVVENSAGEKVEEDECRATLVYDPQLIEGDSPSSVQGGMSGLGNAFTAGLAAVMLKTPPPNASVAEVLLDGIKQGLAAGRKLLKDGFSCASAGKLASDKEFDIGTFHPKYPGDTLFHGKLAEDEAKAFAHISIPIIPGNTETDRGYWRILTDVLESQDLMLDAATLLATKRHDPKKKPLPNKDEQTARDALVRVPVGTFGKYTTYDRNEVESFRALHLLLRDYLGLAKATRPLSIAVFGPPGSGKSFGVKQVAAMLKKKGYELEELTFNLSQYSTPEELSAAFHLVRDHVLKAKTPLVFFDEFDCALDGKPLGWLRSFLAPMQDGEFLDRGAPHPIGKAIFVFAGGTCDRLADFCAPKGSAARNFKSVKAPDFLSRLRGVLDIASLNMDTKFDAYGPTDALPCKAAVLLRRAAALAHQLTEKGPHLASASGALNIDPDLLRTFLHLPHFEHGNRSLEALLDMSRLPDARRYTPSCLPHSSQMALHANAARFQEHLTQKYPFPSEDREKIAKAIHDRFLQELKDLGMLDGKKNPSHNPWEELPSHLQVSNREQADDIARKLRKVNLWFRKAPKGQAPAHFTIPDDVIEELAESEHDRWVAEKRRANWIYGKETDGKLRTHRCIVKWTDSRLSKEDKNKDRSAVSRMPEFLKAGGYEIYSVD